ncbi:hypothetical protein V502_10143 [Pseudogymnoascus sp. VKM F-4520 (FW-2644)]|nr:hypothetical protein V502_10143 [Pseudogymnoascus sp. VKM F-4520 (FW-2644)]
MSYQNYLDTPQTSSASGPRQAPSPSQGMPHANGANGGAAMPGMMGGLPTPAGHQSDLNVIYNMVESLHNELAETRARSERIVAAAGIIRARALEQDLTAEQIAAGVAAELNEGTKNLEEENSRLRHALEHATHEEAAYKTLCEEFAVTMGNALEMGHAYKLKTTLDMCAWHRSYRDQLAAERAENLELRCRISDMQASAARGMEQMRLFRRGWDRSDLVMEMRAEIVSLRQQARGWKRVALSELPSDDSEFSDDDDVIDPEEKKRLARVEEEKRVKEEVEARRAEESGEEEGAAAALAKANTLRAKHALLIILITRNIHLLNLLLPHLAPRTPTQHPKRNHNQPTPRHSRRSQRHTSKRPIRRRDQENRQQRRDTTQYWACETDQHEEAAGERRVREDADAHHPRRLASRERKRFQARVVQDGQRDPEDEEGEGADEGAEGVCEDHAAAGAAACGGAGEALVEDLVEAVEDGAGADDEVTGEAVLGLGV